MTEQDFDQTLNQYFRDAEQEFEDSADQFCALVAKDIRGRARFRRIVLSFFALIGGAIAAFQLPTLFALLDSVVGLDGEIYAVFDALRAGPIDFSFQWLAAITAGMGVFLATFATDAT
ncbi:MAG: hypothetical protein AAFY34_08275 [Pseudomonadota bacterium]